MSQSGIKDDVFSTGYFVEVVISTVGELLKGVSGEMDKAGQTKTEMETVETYGTVSSSPFYMQETTDNHKNTRLQCCVSFLIKELQHDVTMLLNDS